MKIKCLKRMTEIIVVLSILGLILFGCSSGDKTVSSPLAQQPTQSFTMNFQPSPTATVFSTVAPTFTVTPTAKPTTIVEAQPVMGESVPVCYGKGRALPANDGFGIAGTIVYQKQIDQGIYTIGEKPLKWGQLTVPPSQHYTVFGFSPNQNWLAYWPITFIPGTEEPKLETANVQLLSITGETAEHRMDISVLQKQIGPKFKLLGAGNPTYWINDHLIFTTIYFQADKDRMLSSVSKIFDPFTGQWHDEMLVSLPEWIEHAAVNFSPDLDRVLYEGPGLILLDWNTKDRLWTDTQPIARDSVAKWSPDSSLVAYTKYFTGAPDYQVYLLSRNGEKQRLIYQYSAFGFVLQEISWSHNSQYIALSGLKGTGEKILFIFDVVNNKYVFRCPLTGYGDNAPSVLWSPDDSQIALTGWAEPLQILDVQTGQVYALLQNVSAVGWSDQFPVIWP